MRVNYCKNPATGNKIKGSDMKKTVLLFIAAAAVLLTSCARTVIPEEVLQMPEFTPVYTAYDLWYDEDGDMRSENIQQGTILPFGMLRWISFKRFLLFNKPPTVLFLILMERPSFVS